MTKFLGLPLDQALAAARVAGLPEPRIERLEPERRPGRAEPGAEPSGTWRVVREKPGAWTVARFPDAVAP